MDYHELRLEIVRANNKIEQECYLDPLGDTTLTPGEFFRLQRVTSKVLEDINVTETLHQLLHENPQITIREAAEHFDVSGTGLYNTLKEYGHTREDYLVRDMEMLIDSNQKLKEDAQVLCEMYQEFLRRRSQ